MMSMVEFQKTQGHITPLNQKKKAPTSRCKLANYFHTNLDHLDKIVFVYNKIVVPGPTKDADPENMSYLEKPQSLSSDTEGITYHSTSNTNLSGSTMCLQLRSDGNFPSQHGNGRGLQYPADISCCVHPK